jgi:fluoride ion exporter CrcB/FEX
MKFKSVLKTKKFWPSVFTMMVVFIIFYNLIICGLEFRFDVAQFFQKRYVEINPLRSIIANLIGGFAYGFVFVFLQFRGKLKREEKKEQ